MFKLYMAIRKDVKLLLRDKAGLAVMFVMPVLLVIVITSIQNNTFKLVNENKIAVLLCNRDQGSSSLQFVKAWNQMGRFELLPADSSLTDLELGRLMKASEALIAVVIPKGFSAALQAKADRTATQALTELGLERNVPSAATPIPNAEEITLFYNPVLQESFRYSVAGALQSAQQFTENREVLQAIYRALNSTALSDSLQQAIVHQRPTVREVPVSLHGSHFIPDATQHNVPAWTLFAMFFIVVSLSTGLIKERLSGSFIRLQTLPTGYPFALLAKQITYLGVTLSQVAVIFSLGIFLFPLLGLPQLHLPNDWAGLLLVSILCGICAVSYGMCLGVYAQTLEQAIGFGAVSVVLLAAIGGIIVPAFAMPDALLLVMKCSPMYWCLQAYYTLFLEGGRLKDVINSIVPIIALIAVFQSAAWLQLKRQRII